MPPLLADFTHARPCKPFCEKYLTLPQKLMNDPTFKHLSEDCQEYYFDFEAYASHLQEHGKFLVTEHGIFELPE